MIDKKEPKPFRSDICSCQKIKDLESSTSKLNFALAEEHAQRQSLYHALKDVRKMCGIESWHKMIKRIDEVI